jgi:dihydrofolate reductase
VTSLDAALRLAAGDEEVFVIGGAEIFALALPRAERMYVTWVEAEVEGDVTFPQVDWSLWREVSSERVEADEKNEFETSFCVYERLTV